MLYVLGILLGIELVLLAYGGLLLWGMIEDEKEQKRQEKDVWKR